jgi:hypothetical protein
MDGKGNVVMPAQEQQPQRINSFADILKREASNIYNNEMNNETQRLPLIDYAKRGQEMVANNQTGIRAFNTGQDGAQWQRYVDPLDAELKKSQIAHNYANSKALKAKGGGGGISFDDKIKFRNSVNTSIRDLYQSKIKDGVIQAFNDQDIENLERWHATMRKIELELGIPSVLTKQEKEMVEAAERQKAEKEKQRKQVKPNSPIFPNGNTANNTGNIRAGLLDID